MEIEEKLRGCLHPEELLSISNYLATNMYEREKPQTFLRIRWAR